MMKRIILVTFLGILVLAWFFFLTPSGRGLINHEAAHRATNFSGAATAPDNLSADQSKGGLRVANLQNPQQGISNFGKSELARVESNRRERWQSAKNALSIDQEILRLLNDGDLESPRFAYSLFLLCERANENRSSKQVSPEVVRLRLEENKNGKPVQPPITPEEAQIAVGIIDSGLPKNTVDKKRVLSDSFAARCGGSIDDQLGLKVVSAIENSVKAGSALSSAPYWQLKSDADFVTLDKVVRNA